jgi:hypothetical protein
MEDELNYREGTALQYGLIFGLQWSALKLKLIG